MPLLAVRDLFAGYGRTPVLFGVSLEVEAGEIVALLGRNGVGKTATLRSIVGLTNRGGGEIDFAGQPIARRPTHAIARLGVAYVPEDRGVFPGLTVAENLRLGRLNRSNGDPGEDRGGMVFPVLGERLAQDANALSGGERQMLAISRALASQPRLLLLDEFSEGLQPNVVQALAADLATVAASGVGILLVEQNARLALRISNRYYVMEKGAIVDEGPSATLLGDERRLQRHLVV